MIVAAAENNKNARKTYIENHKGRNDIRLIPDVRDYDFSALASEFDGIDVVIGGPPCQGFSNANRQKNHIISMNNSLVKEYFRAVKEIRPKAFVMENVSMLSSETHRFYDSAKDHDVVTSLGVQMREDELVLADYDYNGYSLMNIIQADAVADYKISDELFQLLNVLYKNRNSEERLSKYIKNKSKLIIDKIASQAEELLDLSKSEPQKNSISLFNSTVSWEDFEKMYSYGRELEELFDSGLSVGPVYKMLEFADRAEQIQKGNIKEILSQSKNALWKSNLIYTVERNVKNEKAKNILLGFGTDPLSMVKSRIAVTYSLYTQRNN